MSEAYRVSSVAEDDLVEIGAYIAQYNPEAAVRQVDAILDRFPLLGAQPGIGSKRDDLHAGLRCLAVDRYIIFYRTVDEAEFSIEVVRVLHGSRDLPGVFSETEPNS